MPVVGGTSTNRPSGATSFVQPRQGVKARRLKSQARIFTMMQQEALTSLEVVTGMLSIMDKYTYTLINPSSTYSFISIIFTSYFDK